MGKNKSDLRFDNFKAVNDGASEGRKFEDFLHAWKNSGLTRSGEKLSMDDMVSQWEAPLFIPKVINNIVQEAVEPMLIGTSLLQRIPFKAGTSIFLPVVGAADGEFEVGEEESYPTFQVAIGGGSQIASTGKYGVMVRFTEEILRNSMYDVVSLYTSQAGRAMARYKEEQIFRMLYRQASVSHDNQAPTNSEFGATSGRALDGSFNGGFTIDNLFEMWSKVMANGFIPNMILVHPLTWLMFTQDAQLRHFAQMSQGAYFGYQWSGSPAKNDLISYGGGEGETGAQGRIHPAGAVPGGPAASSPLDFSQNLNSAPVIPGYFGLPMRVVVSPFVPFDHTTNTTTILMADSNQLGFYVDEHGIMTKEWESPETDVRAIRLKERYSIRPKDRGLGVVVAKNVVVTSNQIVLPAHATIDVAGGVTLQDRAAVAPTP